MANLAKLTNLLQGAQSSRLLALYVGNTRETIQLLSLLSSEGFIRGYRIISSRKICVLLKYFNGLPALKGFVRVSTIRQKRYIGVNSLPSLYAKKSFLAMRPIWVLNTQSGICIDIKAKRLGFGGQLLFCLKV